MTHIKYNVFWSWATHWLWSMRHGFWLSHFCS